MLLFAPLAFLKSRRVVRVVLSAALGASAAACGDSSSPAPRDTTAPSPKTRIAIESDARIVGVADTAHVKAFLVDTLGNRTPAAAVTLSVSDGERLRVDSAGNVIGLQPGSGYVVATVGSMRDSVPVTITAFYVTMDTAVMLPNGVRAIAARRYSTDGSPDRVTPGVTWTSSNPAVATMSVDSGGVVHIVGGHPGHTTLTASLLNARATSEIFVQASPKVRFTSVDAGSLSACALTTEGATYCWGLNDNLFGTTATVDRCEQFTHDSGRSSILTRTVTRCARVPIPLATTARFVALRVRNGNGCGVDANGVAYCWGGDSNGQTGNGVHVPVAPPTAIQGYRFKSVVPGTGTTCGILLDDSLSCWGDNGFGTLGTGDTVSSAVPRPVLGNRKWSAVALGTAHVCAITLEGNVYCWGRDVDGELGTGGAVGICNRDLTCSTTPIAVTLPEPMQSISAGSFYTCALGRSGIAYCWGLYSETGRSGFDAIIATPGPVESNQRFVQISSASFGTCALTASGDVYCWSPDTHVPQRNSLVTVPMKQITNGQGIQCGIGTDGYVYCWTSVGQGIMADDTNVQSPANAMIRIVGQP